MWNNNNNNKNSNIRIVTVTVVWPIWAVRMIGSVVTLAWWYILKPVLGLHVRLCTHILLFSIALLLFPFRLLTALHRETMLERLVGEMQCQIESLLYQNEELELRLRTAAKDRHIIETIFQEIEDDHDNALSRIHLLEIELDELKEEKRRLQWQGKALLDYKSHHKKDENIADDHSSWRDTDDQKQKEKQKQKAGLIHNSCSPKSVSGSSITGDGEGLLLSGSQKRERVRALHQSIFSLILSIVVGMTMWKAEDMCEPLVVALFCVVGMSLRSVVRVFSSMKEEEEEKKKPAACDAIALLSLNCFILGALTSPTFPSFVYFLSSHRMLPARFIHSISSFLVRSPRIS